MHHTCIRVRRDSRRRRRFARRDSRRRRAGSRRCTTPVLESVEIHGGGGDLLGEIHGGEEQDLGDAPHLY